MSPYRPPMGTRAPRALMEIWAEPASCPKFRREYQARNRVTRSVSPHRIRPTQASHADSSSLVISVNRSIDRASDSGSIPTALSNRLASRSVIDHSFIGVVPGRVVNLVAGGEHFGFGRGGLFRRG